MGHPLLEQFCRINGVHNCQSHFFNRVQRELQSEIQPMLDERDALLVKVADLEAKLAKTSTRKPVSA
jgi:hypothetical protein